MPQKTNLNVSPYYDDFDKANNFYKVLFKPGYPVQARELTGLQSILQNQIENYGSHVFKEGSMVIPGGITVDDGFTTVKVKPDHLGIDVSVYLDALVSGKVKLKGETSEVVASIKGYFLPPEEGVEEITLFVKYRDGANDGETVQFQDGEVLILQENVSYGNTTLVQEDSVLSLVTTNATAVGYSVGVAKGVYFIRGLFVDTPDSQIVLDPYNNEPSFRVGFEVIEEVVNSDQDPSINDNAKGFSNYAAPGADRLKLSVKLSKKALTDNDDTNFIELVRIDEGEIKKIQNSSQYSEIKKYFAKRTFEESGNYAIDDFVVETEESLNDETGNGGLFLPNEVTDEGNTPKEETLAVQVSAGTAYVRGYDIDLVGSTVLDVPKPRTTKTIENANIPFTMGSMLRINNVLGTPYINIGDPASGGGTDTNKIDLYLERRYSESASGTNTSAPYVFTGSSGGTPTKIGEARVYWFGLTDDSYKDSSTEWDLYLYDIQTYTKLVLSNAYNLTQVPLTSYVRGLSSGATGYLASTTATSSGGSNTMFLNQTSGSFIVGEQIIINEEVEFKTGIISLNEYSVEDIKGVYQDADTLDSNLQSKFAADTVLYPHPLPNFGATDTMTISGSGTNRTAKVAGRFFAGVTGIKEGRTIRYQSNATAAAGRPNYATIHSIASSGTEISLAPPSNSITGVYYHTHVNGSYNFELMTPIIRSAGSEGLYSTLPVTTISSVDLSSSNLTITKQITGLSVASNSVQIQVADAIDPSTGITDVFYESFDAERYSIIYSDGTIEELTGDQFTLGANGTSVTFSGLSATSASNVTIIATLIKKGIVSKTKDIIRSNQLVVSRTQKSKTSHGLTHNKFFGTRIEDRVISLDVPDVVNLRAVYESTDSNAPVLDKLKFATGLSLDQSVVVGEKLLGVDSRAIGQVVSVTATEVFYVKRNSNTPRVGEVVKFSDSAVEAVIQEYVTGSYVDLTANYTLDSGNRHEMVDYATIVRNPDSPTPSKQLLIIFDKYEVASGNSGDLFTVNSYSADRYKNELPKLPSGLKVSDILDFRPRVKKFTNHTTASPFAFNQRQYESTFKYVVSPDESSFLGYSYYLPRVDLVSLNRLGQLEVIQGEPADVPQSPVLSDDAMEIAEISYPPYLFDASSTRIVLKDNRRFTMRDIGKLENRIENLEEVTSLTMLELGTKTTSVTDANGFDRFKTGFIVCDFRDKSLADPRYTTIDISQEGSAGIAPIDVWSMNAELAFDPGIDIETADLTQNLKLADPNIQKTGDMLTLAYNEVDWISQPHATEVENVNPFNVISFVGAVTLHPASDNWTRTIYLPDNTRKESTGAKWKHVATVKKDKDKQDPVFKEYKKGGGRGEKGTRKAYQTTTIKKTTKFSRKLKNKGREFDYVEDIKMEGEVDKFMRSRNVALYANGLRPFTKHYHYIDSQQVDIVPKLCEITMQSGTFIPGEEVEVYAAQKKIAFLKIKAPNHKLGDNKLNEIINGLGSPSVKVEKYTVDPYDRNRTAPGSNYSATSKLINFGVKTLGTKEKYYGYVEVGATVIGKQSGAAALIEKADLISDNWGDVIGNFFFRDPNAEPKPAVRVKSGTKTVKVTATPPNTTTLPGSTVFASEAIGTWTGDGSTFKVQKDVVKVRNPPKPAKKAKLVEYFEKTRFFDSDGNVKKVKKEKVKAPHRDPLAQSFTVDDGSGIFLTSFDLYFARKDPAAKVFVELRTVELGTPTQYLVQDYTQVALNPNDINVTPEGSLNPVPTRVRFESPVYLEAGTEYAIVILSPASDNYEMWVATMGQKTVTTSNVPDVQEVVVSKQYIGGSLFKSQNGTIWTASQYQDLTFKLYKAQFVSSGTLTWHNNSILPKGDNSAALSPNPIEGLPRKLMVPFTGTLNSSISLGDKVIENSTGPGASGFVENIGGSPANGSGSITIVDGGTGYKASSSMTGCNLKSLSGKGTGGEVTISTDGNGVITSVSITSGGSGYVEGELVEIETSSIGSSNDEKRGSGAKFTITQYQTKDTLYLTDVQGQSFSNGNDIYYFTDPDDATTRTTASVIVGSSGSSEIDDIYDGSFFRIKQHNHAHHGGNNKIQVVDIEPDTTKTELTAGFNLTETQVSVAKTAMFGTFEGISTSRGYALIENEVVSYSAITPGASGTGTLTIDGRALNDSVKSTHNKGATIRPYEVNGVSLMRINRSHDIPGTTYSDDNSNIDSYYLKFDRTMAPDRSSGAGLLCFESQKGFGGNSVGISQNYQFSSIVPEFNIITPGKGTVATTNIRTISGTSAGGNETSFIDKGFEPVTLNKVIKFPTPRMIASKVNEDVRLQNMPGNKSLTLRVDFSTENENLSPMMDTQNATFLLGRNKSNAPIKDYVSDSRSNDLQNDPHGAVFATKPISIAQPATSLKVIIAAHREETADFRVFYQLVKVDSTGVEQKFIAFPGYDNLIDTDGDGFGDRVIDPNKNSGRADAFVAANGSGEEEYSEYQFSIDNLDQFTAFAIKIVMSSTNESAPVKLKDFRAIALA
tara:strand:+ start:17691 stop:25220 length:7530 start_codon:yes stop_codon:yes gene_type:complete